MSLAAKCIFGAGISSIQASDQLWQLLDEQQFVNAKQAIQSVNYGANMPGAAEMVMVSFCRQSVYVNVTLPVWLT